MILGLCFFLPSSSLPLLFPFLIVPTSSSSILLPFSIPVWLPLRRFFWLGPRMILKWDMCREWLILPPLFTSLWFPIRRWSIRRRIALPCLFASWMNTTSGPCKSLLSLSLSLTFATLIYFFPFNLKAPSEIPGLVQQPAFFRATLSGHPSWSPQTLRKTFSSIIERYQRNFLVLIIFPEFATGKGAISSRGLRSGVFCVLLHLQPEPQSSSPTLGSPDHASSRCDAPCPSRCDSPQSTRVQ